MAFVPVALPAPVPTPIGAAGELPAGARSLGRAVVGHVVLAVVALASTLPIWWMFATALRPADQALSTSPIPWPLSFDNVVRVFDAIPLASMMGNTFAMALSMSVAQLVVAVLAAYAFAMWDFRFKRVLFLLFIASWLVPFQVTMIPNYLLVSQLGLLGTIAGVVVPNLCSAFAVLLMRQHMTSFPRDLVDASAMDGRSSWGTLWRVVVPNLTPALAALGIMLFISAWNEYLWPQLILKNGDAVLQTGIRSFLSAEGDDWGAVMAASGLSCLPIFLIYLVLQRYVVDAFVRSGLR